MNEADIEVAAEGPTDAELVIYGINISLTMDDVADRIATNEMSLLTGKRNPDKMIELYKRQTDLSNMYNWLVQVKHNRVIKVQQKREEDRKPKVNHSGMKSVL